MFYWKIKEARKGKKMTQEQLAEQLGVKRAVISKYETGLITPSIDQCQKICTILDIPLLALLGLGTEGYSSSEKSLLERLIIERINNDENFDLSKLVDLYFFDENGLRFKGDDINFDELVESFDALNNEGQQKVADYAKDLTRIPQYQRTDDPQPPPDPQEGTDTA